MPGRGIASRFRNPVQCRTDSNQSIPLPAPRRVKSRLIYFQVSDDVHSRCPLLQNFNFVELFLRQYLRKMLMRLTTQRSIAEYVRTCTMASQMSTFVKRLMGSGLMWFSEALRAQWYHFLRTDLLYAVQISTQVLIFL